MLPPSSAGLKENTAAASHIYIYICMYGHIYMYIYTNICTKGFLNKNKTVARFVGLPRGLRLPEDSSRGRHPQTKLRYTV